MSNDFLTSNGQPKQVIEIVGMPGPYPLPAENNNSSPPACVEQPSTSPRQSTRRTPNYPYISPWDHLQIGDISKAGVTLNQAHRLNALMLEYGLQIGRQNVMYQQTLAFIAEKKALNENAAGSSCAINSITGQPLELPSPVDYRKYIPEFIARLRLCKTRSTTNRTGWRYLKWDSESYRHRAITEKDIRFEFETFMLAEVGDGAMPASSRFELLFGLLLRDIPPLEQSQMRILGDHELPFPNGIYNIADEKFTPFTEATPYFATFAMLCRFESNAPNPDAFDAVLSDMFEGNPELMQLAYEFIGALLAPGATLKRIYVFQGVSEGGKTRLAEIILALLDEVDVYAFNTISEIVNDDLVRDARDCRLVYIKEATKNKLAGKQISYLKGFADGGHSRYAVAFKMLLCTNYKLLTGDNDFLEPALKNRFAVLPFPRKMLNTDESVKNFESKYFERERKGIVLKALRAFSRVLQNGGKFSVDYPVNAVVEIHDNAQELTPEEQERVSMVLHNRQESALTSKIDVLLDKTIELIPEVNLDLPAKAIAEQLNSIVPGIVQDTASLGKVLRAHYGEHLIDKRTGAAGKCYNLRFRTLPEAPEVSI